MCYNAHMQLPGSHFMPTKPFSQIFQSPSPRFRYNSVHVVRLMQL